MPREGGVSSTLRPVELNFSDCDYWITRLRG